MSNPKTIAVFGATGSQGGGVVRALRERGTFQVRALTRQPEAHPGIAEEIVGVDLNRPDTLGAALQGVHGVFLVTNFWEEGTDEVAQATAVIKAAKAAGVQHFVWSTLPDVAALSSGRFEVPHFTLKAKVNPLVRAAGFAYHTFIEAPFYFQNLSGMMRPQTLSDGRKGWTLPLTPEARVVHMGDINDLGKVVAGSFERPEQTGQGQTLAPANKAMSFADVVETLNAQGHELAFQQVPGEVFATFYPGAEEMSNMMGFWQEFTYLGPNAEDKMALARDVATAPLVDFATWATTNMPIGGDA